MILLFPDLDTLRLCLASGIVAQEVTLAPAVATFDDQQRIYVEPRIALSKTTMKHLDRLGVKGSKRHATEDVLQVSCWLELVPAVKEAAPPALSSQATVLFELESGADLPVLVAEMLRLGNDRQSFRWFALSLESDARRVLLRVIGPPYYTLLRALDRTTSGSTGRVRAYIERSPRVWVELGYDHPFAAQVRVSESQLVLIRESRTWQFLNEAPFQDIYDILKFQLPSKPIGWTEATSVPKLVVPLRLTAGNAADVAEMWVLRGDGVRQLDSLVRDADDRLIQRLTFAVATDPQGRETVVLRTRPSKLPPPALPLEHASAYKPFSKLPNLFVPVGRRLHPTLRRDAVRRLLADDADQVVWLFPDEKDGFVPECIPDAAFRSLEDWVEYVIEAERQPLAAWIEATRFDFDHFIGQDTGGPKPKPDSGDKPPQERGLERSPTTKAFSPQAKPGGKGKGSSRAHTPAEFAAPPEALVPNEWKRRREELQQKFLTVDGPLDHPDRRAMWSELAAANTGEGHQSEAALCWLNAIWDSNPFPPMLLAGWLRSELRTDGSDVTPAELDRWLKAAAPSVNDLRVVIAGFLWTANQQPTPSWLPERFTAIQKFIESHEESLPIRAVWLVALQLARLTGSDVLGLARVRDRLLQRLLMQGLSAEKDLPGFLRFAGLRDAERLQVVRDKALDLHRIVREWTAHLPLNLPYVDLFFAFGLSRLGETTSAKKLLDAARSELIQPGPNPKDVTIPHHSVNVEARTFLLRAFEYRIEQAMQGRPHSGPFSPEILNALELIKNQRGQPAMKVSGRDSTYTNALWQALYVIDRMRKDSRILEPNELPEPYRATIGLSDPLQSELLLLTDTRNPKHLADRIRWLYQHGAKGKPLIESQCHVVHEALTLAPRVGEQFCLEVLELVPSVLQPNLIAAGYPPTPAEITRKRGEIVDRAIVLSAHFGRSDLVQQFVRLLVELVKHEKPESQFILINTAAKQCLRHLKKYGMRDQIEFFLQRMQEEAIQGRSIAEIRIRYEDKPDMWIRALQTLVNLAGGWLTIGLHAEAKPYFDVVRNELLSPNLREKYSLQYTELAQSYIAALGHGDSESGLVRIREFFENHETAKIADNWTGSHTYTRLHMKLVEEAIHALVSDEFALGPAGRKWLDDDEYLVRRRIHDDMKRHLERSGL